MKDLARIEAIWAKLDLALETELVGTTKLGFAKLLPEQIVNAPANFILCWGKLEIDCKCRNAVRRRKADPDWRIRRGWDLFNPDSDRFSGLSFENRARLVLDANGGRRSAFGLTMKHYGLRNRIAPGRLELTRIAVSAFVQDCFTIQAALNRSV